MVTKNIQDQFEKENKLIGWRLSAKNDRNAVTQCLNFVFDQAIMAKEKIRNQNLMSKNVLTILNTNE